MKDSQARKNRVLTEASNLLGCKEYNCLTQAVVIFVAHRHPGALSPNHLAKFKRFAFFKRFLFLMERS